MAPPTPASERRGGFQSGHCAHARQSRAANALRDHSTPVHPLTRSGSMPRTHDTFVLQLPFGQRGSLVQKQSPATANTRTPRRTNRIGAPSTSIRRNTFRSSASGNTGINLQAPGWLGDVPWHDSRRCDPHRRVFLPDKQPPSTRYSQAGQSHDRHGAGDVCGVGVIEHTAALPWY